MAQKRKAEPVREVHEDGGCILHALQQLCLATDGSSGHGLIPKDLYKNTINAELAKARHRVLAGAQKNQKGNPNAFERRLEGDELLRLGFFGIATEKAYANEVVQTWLKDRGVRLHKIKSTDPRGELGELYEGGMRSNGGGGTQTVEGGDGARKTLGFLVYGVLNDDPTNTSHAIVIKNGQIHCNNLLRTCKKSNRFYTLPVGEHLKITSTANGFVPTPGTGAASSLNPYLKYVYYIYKVTYKPVKMRQISSVTVRD